MPYGILDTQDNLWLGDDNGPKVFDDFVVARIAAQVWEDQVLGSDLGGRFQAREIAEGSWAKRDELQVKRSALDSLRRIEGTDDEASEPINLRFYPKAAMRGRWGPDLEPLPGGAACVKCAGKGFLYPDGSIVNAFEGSDQEPVIPCPACNPESESKP